MTVVLCRFSDLLDKLYAKFKVEVNAQPEQGWKLSTTKDGIEIFVKKVMHENGL